MFAVWEYEEDSWRFNLILKLIKDLMALTSDGKLFQKCAPPPLLWQGLRFKKSVRGLGRANLCSIFHSP